MVSFSQYPEWELTGLGFPEALRWHNDSLWFSDMFRSRVVAWRLGAEVTTELDVNNGGPVMPGGLGWTQSGELLVVDCLERLVIRVSGSGDVSTYADLSSLTSYPINDMHVDEDGVAWVGGYGFDPDNEKPVESPIYKILTTGEVLVSETRFVFPNGMEKRGSELVIAETFADRISSLNIDTNSTRAWNLESGCGPDGLSFAPDGSVFVAMAFSASIGVCDADGRSSIVYSLEESRDSLGGPKGIFDCAIDPNGELIAFSTACLDERYSQNHDTGAVKIFRLGE